MKKLIYFLFVFQVLLNFQSTKLYAQATPPEGIIYQAEARDSKGNPIRNKDLQVQISILAGSPTGSSEWKGDYNISTDNNGLFTIIVGQGKTLQGNFSTINWGSGDHFLNVQVNDKKGWVDMGSTQLLTVPYAFYAKSAGNGLTAEQTAAIAGIKLFNNYPVADQTKLAGIEDGAQKNVQADWNASEGSAQILNKPVGNNPGDMQYWNGSAWVMVPAGLPGQFLKFVDNKPEWCGILPSPATTLSQVFATTANASYIVFYEGSSNVTTKGICYSTSPNPTTTNSKISTGPGLGGFQANLTGLTPMTTYYIRSFATNSTGTAYGNEISFTTTAPVVIPTVITTTAYGIAQGIATSGGIVNADGGATVTGRGVCFSTSPHPTLATNYVIGGSGMGTYTVNINSLMPNTLYYYRAYATNSAGTGYGNEYSFTTLPIPVTLTVSTSPFIELTSTSAKSGGFVTTNNASDVSVRGVCWNTTGTPTITDYSTADGSGDGSFISSLTGLTPNTTYYFRAYAKNSAGYVYGSVLNLMTPSPANLPTVTTTPASDITPSSALLGATIGPDGGSSVTIRGICYSTIPHPTLASSNMPIGTGTGIFTANLISLTPNTTYYYMAYATNSAGTGYGRELSFTTLPAAPSLIVTTTPVTEFSSTTAKSGGLITSDGTVEVIARGVCWNTTPMVSPTIMDAKTTDGMGTGSFQSNLTSLTASTTYYVRAYATTGTTTVYGNVIMLLTTSGIILPSISTDNAVAINPGTITTGGHYGFLDGAPPVTSMGVCWSTSHNPKITDPHTTDSGSLFFTSTITGLNPGTTYYIRAYITNITGTAYGYEVSCTPALTGDKPILTTAPISNISLGTATCGGNMSYSGSWGITAKGVCWSTSQNPTISDPHSSEGPGISPMYTSFITGLNPGTTYYVRAYATNFGGTAYGDQITFTTTTNVQIPITVNTTYPTVLTKSKITVGGNITSDGGFPVITRGITWGTTQTPSPTDVKTTEGQGLGSFSSDITGFPINTSLWVRAYATNIMGTTYGNSYNIMASSSDLPFVGGFPPQSTSTSITGNGYVYFEGGSIVTERGICFSTSPTPTVDNTKVIAGIPTGPGGYSSTLNGLSSGVTYYLRPYAINSFGVSYGHEEIIATK